MRLEKSSADRIAARARWTRRAALRSMLAAPVGLALALRAGAARASVAPAGETPATVAPPVSRARPRTARVISVETLVGDQSGPGRFKEPRGLTLGPDGTIYVVEGASHRIQRLALDGGHLGFIGGPGDGPGQLREPTALAFDADGTLLVADTGHARVVRLALDGSDIASWTASGRPSEKQVTPYGIAIAVDGSVYVSDPESKRIERYARDGSPSGVWATEDRSVSLATAPDGTLWSAEREAIGGAKTTFRGRIRRYSPTGDVLTTLTTVTWPEALTLAPDGTLIVSDNGHFLWEPFAARRLSVTGEDLVRACYGLTRRVGPARRG